MIPSYWNTALCLHTQVVLPFSSLPFSGCPSFSLFILQRHLEAYWKVHRLRDALHRRYAALLKDKVHSQRLLLQQRSETARGKPENESKQVDHYHHGLVGYPVLTILPVFLIHGPVLQREAVLQAQWKHKLICFQCFICLFLFIYLIIKSIYKIAHFWTYS